MADNILDRFADTCTEERAVDASRKVKVGIIGTGWIAEAHVREYLAMEDVEIVALADLAEDALRSDVLLEGQANLFNHRELGGNVIELMEFLRKGDPIAKLIARGTDDVDIKIGTENEYKQLANSSVIISHYDINGERSGALGIIGPTRLNYAKLIPYMQFVSGLVGKILTETLDE